MEEQLIFRRKEIRMEEEENRSPLLQQKDSVEYLDDKMNKLMEVLKREENAD